MNLDIYVDADACPVKGEILRVAERHGLTVYLVSNQWLRTANTPNVRQIVVPEGADAADNWIVDHIEEGDICISADIPLAARCIDKAAYVVNMNGKRFTEDSIGMTLATRELMTHLRETGEISGGGKPFTKQDRSRFLQELEQVIQTAKRGMANPPAAQ